MMWQFLFRPWLIFIVTWAIVCDFLYHIPVMIWYVQFGPIILTIVVGLIAALMDVRSKNIKIGEYDKTDEEKEEDDDTSDLKIVLFIPVYLIALVVSLKAIYGTPNSRVWDYTNFDFWMFIILISAPNIFKYWPHGKENKKGGMRT
ncbi:hypothetical protein ACFOU0_08300 [Salinicoccus sesuvii]|uniref:Uncharacterized protein n=1 Tax=Salinicoccus sesuvii TaxID=868281 RepID=A0ABV7N6V1_9STAP